jgi:adenylate cyclase
MKGALTKKLGIKGDTHRLYMQEKGRRQYIQFRSVSSPLSDRIYPPERALGPNQSPAMILHRRLEQAGYAPSDDLETLGGEDLGFLIRFIFRNASLGIVEVCNRHASHFGGV